MRTRSLKEVQPKKVFSSVVAELFLIVSSFFTKSYKLNDRKQSIDSGLY